MSIGSSFANRRINAELTKVLTKQSSDHHIQLIAEEIKAIVTNASYHNQMFDADTKTFTAAIRSCNSQEEYNTALEVFDVMNRSRAIPDRLTYGVAMTACMHTCNSRQAEVLFRRCNEKFKYGSSKNYCKEDTAMFSLMIATFDVVGKWPKVIVTYDEIDKLDSLKPSVEMINSALRASKRQLDWIKYDEIVSSLAVLGNVKKDKSSNDENSNATSSNRKSMHECLIALESSASTADIGAAIAQVTAESADEEGEISLLISKLESILSTDPFFVQLIVNDSKLRRRIKRLLDKLIVGPSVRDDELVIPTLSVYKTMIRGEGLRNNSEVAFQLFKEALSILDGSNHEDSSDFNTTTKQQPAFQNVTSMNDKKGLYRCLIEACVQADDQILLAEAKRLLREDFADTVEKSAYDDTEPTSTFSFEGREYSVKNGPSAYSGVTRKLLSVLLNTNSSLYRSIDVTALPERGLRIPPTIARDILTLHCEKQALGGLLQMNSMSAKPFNKSSLLSVRVNLCMCDDCHSFFKAASHLLKVPIKCKDPSGTHGFNIDGVCSCSDHWGGR